MAEKSCNADNLYGVECMSCGQEYTRSTIEGSTGICDECLDAAYPPST